MDELFALWGWRKPRFALPQPSFLCVVLFRLSRLLLLRGFSSLSAICRLVNLVLTGADISPHCDMGPGLVIVFPAAVVVQARAGRNCTVVGVNMIGPEEGKDGGSGAGCPNLGDNVHIGMYAIMLGPIAIGDGVEVPPGAIVRSDVPAGTALEVIENRILRSNADNPSRNHRPAALRCSRHRSFSALRLDLREDIHHYIKHASDYSRGGEGLVQRISALLTPQVFCIFLYRLAHWLHANGHDFPALLVSRLNCFLHKVTLPVESCIGGGVYIPHQVAVTFFGEAGRGLTLYASSSCMPDLRAAGGAAGRPLLGDNVTIGASSVIYGEVTIGNNARIGAGATVNCDIPPGAVVVSMKMLPVVNFEDGEKP